MELQLGVPKAIGNKNLIEVYKTERSLWGLALPCVKNYSAPALIGVNSVNALRASLLADAYFTLYQHCGF